jgi:hypothetical protein
VNIESKTWKVVSLGHGLAQIICKNAGCSQVVQRADLPHTNALAAMTEARFDAVMQTAFETLRI